MQITADVTKILTRREMQAVLADLRRKAPRSLDRHVREHTDIWRVVRQPNGNGYPKNPLHLVELAHCISSARV